MKHASRSQDIFIEKIDNQAPGLVETETFT